MLRVGEGEIRSVGPTHQQTRAPVLVWCRPHWNSVKDMPSAHSDLLEQIQWEGKMCWEQPNQRIVRQRTGHALPSSGPGPLQRAF
jgi:hypothetical protein